MNSLVLGRPLAALTSAFLVVLLLPISVRSQTLVASWPFSGNANDATGNGHNGTVNGAQLVLDRFGNANSAYLFDGASWIRVAHATPLAFGTTSAFTINAWIKVCQSMTDFAGIVSKGPPSVNYPGYQMFVRSGSNLAGEVGLTNGNWIRTQGTGNIADSRWHMVTYEVSTAAGTLRLYVDGVLDASTSSTTAIDPSSTYTNDLIIGRERNALAYFKGAIDDVRIYSGTLSNNQLLTLYNENGWPVTPPPPTVSVSMVALDPTTICTGGSVRLNAGSGTATSYRWEPLTGLSDPSSLTPTARPAVTTTYRFIGVRTLNDAPCPTTVADTESVTITVRPAPSVSLNRMLFVCRGRETRIGAPADAGTPPLIYQWSPVGGLNDASLATPTATVTSTTKYYVTITDALGCVVRDSVLIQILVPPALALRDTTVCRGGGVIIGADATGSNPPLIYKWTPAAGLSSDAVARPMASPDVTTRYEVLVTDAAGCSTTAAMNVRVHPAVGASAGEDAILCPGERVRIGRPGSGGLRYAWFPAAGLSNSAASDPEASPTTTTTYALTVVDPATGCSGVDSVTVVVRAAQLAAATRSLDFGTLDGCTSSSERTLTVRNTGSDTLILESATIVGDDFVVAGLPPAPIAPGDSAVVRVRFAPQSAGAATGTLTVRAQPCALVLEVDLEGVKDELLADARPSSVDFGRLLECDFAPRDTVIRVRNSGGAPMTIEPATLAAPFSIVAPPLPQTIAPNDSLLVTIRYAPTAPGTHTANLTLPFRSGGCSDSLRIALGGLVAQQLLAAASTLDLGTLTGCETARDTTVTLYNRGLSSVRLDSARATPGVRVTASAPATLQPGDSFLVVVRFEPSATGPFTGRLVVYIGPCADSVVIDISGGKLGVAFETPDSIEFGELVDCRESSRTLSQSLLLRDDAGGGGTVSSVTIEGPFTTTLADGTPLVSGARSAFDVTMTPVADGVVTGTLTLVLEPCGVTRRIVLTGRQSSAALSFTSAIDFGAMSIGSSADRQVILSNTGSTTQQVDAVTAPAPFAVIATVPTVPTRLAPGATMTVTVRYVATSARDSASLVAVGADPCMLTALTPLSGTADDRAACIVVVPRLAAAPGASVDVVLVLDSAIGLDRAGAHAFTATIAFDRSVLVPVDRAGVTESGRTRRVKIDGRRVEGSPTLATIAMTATLGAVESTLIVIEEFSWLATSEPVTVGRRDGAFTVDSLCREGGTRLYFGDPGVLLRPVRPNPARSTIEVDLEVFEPGVTRVSIVDALGATVHTLAATALAPGRHLFSVDVSSWSPGAYQVVLQTPTLVRSQRVEVVR